MDQLPWAKPAPTPRSERWRRRVRQALDDPITPVGRVVNFVILAAILIACAIFVMRTYALPAPLARALEVVEWAITVLFTLEYLARLWVAERRVRHLFRFTSMIDLLAILPTFVAESGFQAIRVIRVLRIMRLVRFLEDPKFFFGTLRRSQLMVLRIVVTLVGIVFVSAALVYQAEHRDNPAAFGTFFDGVYFAVVTLTTVGFGDITPKSDYGRLVTLLVILSGIVLLPWQIKNLVEAWVAGAAKRDTHCGACGLLGHDLDALFCRRCGAHLSDGVLPPGQAPPPSRAATSGPAAPQAQPHDDAEH